MATFLFEETDGTDLETIDSKWSGDSTTLVTASGGIQPSTAFGDRSAYYSNSHPNDQTSEGVLAAGSYAGGEIKGLLLNWDGTNGYEIRIASTQLVIRRNGSFAASASHGVDPTTNDITFKATVVSGVVKGYANGTEIVSYTDGTPLTGGGPGIHLAAAGTAANCRFLSWNDGVASNATLSAPSATPGTTTATISATTDQSTGTLYVVVDTAANLSGVTAAQIKAGQKAGGSAALAANSAAVSTTTPSAGVTGLSATTLYSFAAVQNNANGDSNVVTGTFTTLDPTLDQSHFRWRNDDGSETTATWAAAEDTNVTIAALTPKRLRVEITATNDPASKAYRLQYRKVGETYWRDVN